MTTQDFLDVTSLLPDPLLLITVEGLILAANPAAQELLRTGGDPSGRTIFSMSGEPEPTLRKYLEFARVSPQAPPGTLHWRLDDGTTVSTRCDAALLSSSPPDHKLLVLRLQSRHESLARFRELDEQIAAMGNEMAANLRAQDDLERSERRFRSLIENSGDGLLLLDSAGVIRYAGPPILGYEAEEWTGRTGFNLIHPEDREQVMERFAEISQIPDMEMKVVFRVKDSSANWRSLEAVAKNALNDPDVNGIVVNYRDITERKLFEDKLRHSQKLESLGVLAGGVAHDFNNLLVGILGNASLALETVSTNNPAHTMLHDIMSAGETAAHLTKQLLAYAGKGRFIIQTIDLSDLVRQISSLIQTSIPRNVQLRLELQDRLPCVEADTGQLQQVIMNLVINGAEAIGETQNGTVLVTTGAQEVDEHYVTTVLAEEKIALGTYVSLEVHDTGSGMDEATMAKIFDPFFTTKFTGRGLGLAAVLGIVRGHKGAMKVYSTPGKGSTFKVLFPASDEQPTRPRIHEQTQAKHAPATILVVDDEPVVRRTAKALLERYGYTVVLAENGKEGVDLFRVLADKISAVLLDMTMPVMGGEEALRHLKSIRPDVRVILTSGYNEVEAVRRFTGKGLAGFIQKPYSAAALAERVRAVISGS